VVQVLLTILHVFVCAFLVLVILLQQGRGGGMGAAFGGASQQVFGGAGAGNFLTKITEACAFTFMFTSILLAGLSSQRGPSKYEEAAKVIYEGPAAAVSAAPSVSAPAPLLPNLPTFPPSPTTPEPPPVASVPNVPVESAPPPAASVPAPPASAP
jgi:preprotein translocase subunit SecG